MSFAKQQIEELRSKINHIMLNNHPDRTNDPALAWADLCELENKMVTCQKIADEEDAEEEFNNGQFGAGA